MADQAAEDDSKLAEEWAAMSGDGDIPPESAETPRVLNQNEIDSLLGFGDGKKCPARPAASRQIARNRLRKAVWNRHIGDWHGMCKMAGEPSQVG